MDCDACRLRPWTLRRLAGMEATLKTNKSLKHRSFGYWSGFVILLTILASSTPRINAQLATTTATLSGVVSDPTGLVLPTATVALSSTEKGINRTFVADAGGRYLFTQ